jgi:hypothetical protein
MNYTQIQRRIPLPILLDFRQDCFKSDLLIGKLNLLWLVEGCFGFRDIHLLALIELLFAFIIMSFPFDCFFESIDLFNYVE